MIFISAQASLEIVSQICSIITTELKREVKPQVSTCFQGK